MRPITTRRIKKMFNDHAKQEYLEVSGSPVVDWCLYVISVTVTVCAIVGACYFVVDAILKTYGG